MQELNQLATKLLEALKKFGGLTIAVAESSTGGLFTEALTSVSGASAAFRLGIVGYSNDAKMKAIGVPKKVFRKCGAVSEPAAAAMAHFIRKKDRADIGVSITGVAGPTGGSEQKPVGTTYIAVSFIGEGKRKQEKIAVRALTPDHFPDTTRETIREYAVATAMMLVMDLLNHEEQAALLEKSASHYRKYLAPSPIVAFVRYLIPWRGDAVGDVLLKMLLLATIAAASVAATELTRDTVFHYQNTQVLEQAVDAIEKEPLPEQVNNLPEGYLDKFAALYEINDEIAGWVTIPDTNVNLPVVQTDNNEFYLQNNLKKEHDINGVPFLDFRNRIKPEEFSTNTLIYGHNMTSGNIFRDLVYYKDVEYYKQHPILTFDTIYEESQWLIFSCFEANTETRFGEVFQYFNFVNTTKPDRIQWYIDEVTSRSYFNAAVDVNIDDTFLTLQTCANDKYETKICIVARKLRDGESVAVDVDAAVSNDSRVRPNRTVS